MAVSILRSFRLPEVGLTLITLTSLPAAHAAWEAVPAVSLEANADDNLLLDTSNEQSATRMLLDAGVLLTNFTERGNVYLEPRVVADSYTDDEHAAFETEDYFLNAGGQYGWQTAEMGFRARYAEQLLLRAEFADLLPDDPDVAPGEEFNDPDTGRLVFSEEKRERIDFRGNFTLQASQRDSIRFDVGAQDVSYSAPDTPRWSDYDNADLGVAYVRSLAPRSTISVAVTTSEFNADRNSNTTETTGIRAVYVRPLSQTWTLNLNAGYERADYSFLGAGDTLVDNEVSASTFGVSFRKRTERSTWNVDVASRVQPNGSGFLVERNELRLFGTYYFTQRLLGRFGLRYADTTSLDDVREEDDRTYMRSGVELEWALRPTLFLTFALEQLTQDFVSEADGKATSNAVYVGVTYRGRSRQDAL